ncbi:cation-transporting P-type ATPase [Streptomyces sp. MOE7]|uniref:cation-transporting P-type ATPase n=1 Tax=Streptomyces sp. MOE7 TaxID=1961713 RepID=UPI000A029A9F|nr:cation-transporting P-type ATPase [Streptomyces sp. MOE7]
MPTEHQSAGPGAVPGLSEQEAARRLAVHGPNALAVRRSTPWWQRAGQQLRDPLIVVLLAAAALTLATGDRAYAAVILLVVAVNTTAGYVQEVEAEQAVAALSAMSAPAARVLRGGADRSVVRTDSSARLPKAGVPAPGPGEFPRKGPFGPPRRAAQPLPGPAPACAR